MKMTSIALILLASMMTNVLAESAREYAPGQVKKRHGAESAREFAPGQVKKSRAPAPATPQTLPHQLLGMPLAPAPGATQQQPGPARLQGQQPAQVTQQPVVQQGQAVSQPAAPRKKNRGGDRGRDRD